VTITADYAYDRETPRVLGPGHFWVNAGDHDECATCGARKHWPLASQTCMRPDSSPTGKTGNYQRTHCRRGHLLAETRVTYGDGRRACRRCATDRELERQRRAREGAL
jgi:hypothetical protein